MATNHNWYQHSLIFNKATNQNSFTHSLIFIEEVYQDWQTSHFPATSLNSRAVIIISVIFLQAANHTSRRHSLWSTYSVHSFTVAIRHIWQRLSYASFVRHVIR